MQIQFRGCVLAFFVLFILSFGNVPTLCEAKTHPATDEDCQIYLQLIEDSTTENGMAQSWFHDRMQRVINAGASDIAAQWVCLRNGSLTQKDPDFLKTVSYTDGKRDFPRLRRLKQWTQALYSELSHFKKRELQHVLIEIEHGFPATAASEQEIFKELFRAYEKKGLSLVNLLEGYSLYNLTASDYENFFRIR